MTTAHDVNFWTKVFKTKECWIWTGATNAKGYGIYHLPGSGKNGKTVLAHRYAKGMPDVEAIMHICDNPPCVRPDHLVDGDRAANNKDAAAKGRTRNGSVNITRCPQGHAYDDVNTYINPSGARACRECRRKQRRDSRARKASA